MILVVDISKDIVRETGVEFVKWPLNKPIFFAKFVFFKASRRGSRKKYSKIQPEHSKLEIRRWKKSQTRGLKLLVKRIVLKPISRRRKKEKLPEMRERGER